MAENYTGAIGIVFQRSPQKFLLIHNKSTGNVSFPAGGREPGEMSSKQSLERELREETGLNPSDYRLIETPIIHQFVYNSNKKDRAGKTAVQPVYLVETHKLALTPNDPDAQIQGWFPEEETVEKLSFPDSKELFKKAVQYLNSRK